MKTSVKIITIALASALLMVSCKTSKPADSPVATYENPVIKSNCPDPYVLDNRERDGWIYLYSTASNNAYLPVYRTKNLVDWEFVGDGFDGKMPDWRPGYGLWAPDVHYVDGKYHVYYALGGGRWTGDKMGHAPRATGVATSDSPTGPFEDHGMIISYENTGIVNSIDPNFFEWEGKKYMYWGSVYNGSGIFIVQLTDDGLSINTRSEPLKVAGNDQEGVYAHVKDGYVYLFVSEGRCCRGEASDYHVAVGRSKFPHGPFFSKDGQSMIHDLAYYETKIMQSSPDRTFVGTGHTSNIITDDAGNDWILYHAFWKEDEYTSRYLLLDRVHWDEDGWPIINDGTPSMVSEAPVFNQD
ncbi:MAG: family 43 glycosylhydrolase [Bacteroidales bacterium]|nr:family 43 glycosylhydrolase [Bacteroidales bacterium]